MGWENVINVQDVLPDKDYFMGMRTNGDVGRFYFVSRDINGKVIWSVKAGIAVKFRNEALTQFREKNPNPKFVIIEVPADADTRWKRRKKRPSYLKRK